MLIKKAAGVDKDVRLTALFYEVEFWGYDKDEYT